MKTKVALFIILGFLSARLGEAQSFEVASIKPNRSGNGYNGGCHGIDSGKGVAAVAVPLGRCVITSARLSHVMTIAFGIELRNLKGEPDWGRSGDRFDIDAKAENPATATEAELLKMLQNLLVERFQLKLRRETQQVSGYALVVAKNGPKFKEATGESRSFLRLTGAAINKFDSIDQKNLDQNSITAQRTSMGQFVNMLANLPDSKPVIDKTGLKGVYDFKVAWEPGESVSSVLQEQLGLKLEPQNVPVELLIIDSAEKPVAN